MREQHFIVCNDVIISAKKRAMTMITGSKSNILIRPINIFFSADPTPAPPDTTTVEDTTIEDETTEAMDDDVADSAVCACVSGFSLLFAAASFLSLKV